MNAVDATREAAIAAADAGATWQWKERAFQTIVSVAERMQRFTSEDVWDAGLGTEGAGEGDALGPVMRRVARAGLIRSTKEFETETKRAQRHNNPKRVWQSLIYKGEEERDAA